MSKWPVVQLGEVTRQRNGFVLIDDFTEYKRCRVQLHAQGIVLRDTVSGAEIKTKKQQVCKAGDFLVAEIDAKVGGFGIVPDELHGAIVSSHYFLFEINEEKLNRRFLDYFICTPAFRDQVAAQGSTNYAAIRPNQVLGYEIPLPPLPEQRRIVARIEELAAKINEARALRRKCLIETELWWPNLLREVLAGESAHEGIGETARELLAISAKRNNSPTTTSYNNAHPWKPEIVNNGPVELPPAWVWTTLGSVLTHLVDCINDTPDFADFDTGLIGLKSTNIRPYKLDLSRRWFMTNESFEYWNRREKPRQGDVVLTREAPMGNACILPSEHEFCLTQRLLLLRVDPETILPKMLLHYLNSPYFREQVDEKCRGLTTPHIRVQDAPDFVLPLPPMDRQQRIITALDAVQSRMNLLSDLQSETAREVNALLPSILDKAFKGEL
jgi:type I restriction enzyme S subunit